MGIQDPNLFKYDFCDQCGLKISRGEYILMGWALGKNTPERKSYCEQYHDKILKGQKERTYDYEWSFGK